jgi:hypothetical protein
MRVANHPQSLWITLWTSFRHLTQVAYRKGFFFVRSNFERSEFYTMHQRLRVTFPLSRTFPQERSPRRDASAQGGG